MGRLWRKISLISLGLLTFFGIYSNTGIASASQQKSELKIDNVDETTPLYLTHANNLHANSLGVMTAEHESHYSHESHDSHYSHDSHSSHYSHSSGY